MQSIQRIDFLYMASFSSAVTLPNLYEDKQILDHKLICSWFWTSIFFLLFDSEEMIWLIVQRSSTICEVILKRKLIVVSVNRTIMFYGGFSELSVKELCFLVSRVMHLQTLSHKCTLPLDV